MITKGVAALFTLWMCNQTAIVLQLEAEVRHAPDELFVRWLTYNKTLFTPDCCVKLWNIDALLNKPELAKGALLATLSAHTKYVNVVRWSKDGKFLASGSDDENIMIYKFTPGAIISRTYGSSAGAAKDTESWSRCARFL